MKLSLDPLVAKGKPGGNLSQRRSDPEGMYLFSALQANGLEQASPRSRLIFPNGEQS